METKRPCKRCTRPIDVVARICPFCNQDQGLPVEALPENFVAAAPPRAKNDSARRMTTRVLVAIAVVVLLVAIFSVGVLVNKFGTKTENKPVATATTTAPVVAPATGNGMADLTLVPVSEGAPPPNIVEMPVTSSPVPSQNAGLPPELQRNDVTALPSEQYAKIVEESRPKPKAVTEKSPVEPAANGTPKNTIRFSTPPAISTAASEVQPASEPPPPAAERSSRADRTDPVPIYQPLPNIRNRSKEIKHDGTMRFRLRVGADGNVTEVEVLESMEGLTDKMIAAIQKWRFRPATQGGAPVAGSFPVEISFKAGDE